MVAATISVSKTNQSMPGVLVYKWEGLDGDDVGAVVKLPAYRSMTAQLGANGGNTDGGSTTVLQGSNDQLAETDPANAVWFTLTEKDTASTAISRTTSAILKEVKESPLYVRPSQSGGTAGDLDVIITLR